MSGENNRHSRIHELEGLRGMAAVAILAYHVAEILQPVAKPFPWLVFVFVYVGGISVIVFFILSGFVIGYIHQEPWNGTNVAKYLLRRLVRLYPIYVVALVLSFLVARQSLLSWQFVGHLMFLQGAVVPIIPTNGPLWSLHFEAVYYLLFLVVWRFPKSLKWLACLSAIAVAASIWNNFILIRVLALFNFWLFGCWLAKTGTPNPVVAVGRERFWLALFCFCACSAAGGWWGVAKRLGGFDGLELGWVASGPLIADVFLSVKQRRIVPWLAWPAYVASILLTCLGLAYGVWSGKFTREPFYAVGALFLLLAVLAAARRWPGPPPSFWSAISSLGAISYALYVIHLPILRALTASAGTTMTLVGGTLLAVALVFLFAWVLERRFQPWISNFLKPRLALGRRPTASVAAGQEKKLP